MLYLKKEYLRRFAFSVSNYAIQYRGPKFCKWAMVLGYLIILFIHYCRFAGLELTRRVLGLISLLTLRKEKAVQSVFGNLNDRIIGVRVFLLWEKGCQFSASDLMFVSEYFKDPEIGSCLVVNCECLDFSSHISLLQISQLVVVRKNIGYDWGGYRDAVMLPEIITAKFVTVMNNSILVDSSRIEWVRQQELLALKCNGVSGLVESAYPIPHLQSFSITFSQYSLITGLEKWIRNIKYSNNKYYVVRRYEIGLSKEITRLNIDKVALLPYETFFPWALENWDTVLGKHAQHPAYKKIYQLLENNLSINPSHALWRFIQSKEIKITKKELFRKNPLRLPDVVGE